MNSKKPWPVSSKLSRTGDLVGFSGHNLDSYFINAVTYGLPGWGLSHVGIVCWHAGEPLIFESTMDCPTPCVVTCNYGVRGVQAQRLTDHIKHYKGKIWYYPLKERVREAVLHRFLLSMIGRPYDDAGARRAAGKVWSAILGKESLTELFCSELVAAALREVALLQTERAGRWSPNALIREIRPYYYDPVRCK